MTRPEMTRQHDIPDDATDEFELAPPDRLYAHHRRQLSAMMDGELSPDAAKFMLRRLEHDGGLSGCWERWQVCGDVLRGQRSSLLPADFPQRVAAAIAVGQQSGNRGRTATAGPRRLRWGGRAALAASVAAVAFLLARQMPGEVAPAAPAEPARVAASQGAGAGAGPAASEAPSAVGTDLFLVAAASAPEPAPASPAAPAAETVAAAALASAVAVSEVPRRAAARRSSAQVQRAASNLRARTLAEPAAAASGARPVLASLPAAAPVVLADPFATQPVAPARPWPRAVLPAMGSGDVFSAGYGAATSTFEPFVPRFAPLAPEVTSAPADGGGTVDPVDGGPSDEAAPGNLSPTP